MVRHSETLEALALYETLYENDLGKVWVRPLAMFSEEVLINGANQPRFQLEAPLEPFEYYHSHVYFETSEREEAHKLHEKIKSELSGLVRTHGVIDKPIGPHPLPMFEADFLGKNYLKICEWLLHNRGNLNVLIHPLSGDALADHTTYAQFLGAKLPLDLRVL